MYRSHHLLNEAVCATRKDSSRAGSALLEEVTSLTTGKLQAVNGPRSSRAPVPAWDTFNTVPTLHSELAAYNLFDAKNQIPSPHTSRLVNVQWVNASTLQDGRLRVGDSSAVRNSYDVVASRHCAGNGNILDGMPYLAKRQGNLSSEAMPVWEGGTVPEQTSRSSRNVLGTIGGKARAFSETGVVSTGRC